MEKKIIKPADIWMTLRLPTLVSANNPAFSLKPEQCKHAKDANGYRLETTTKFSGQNHALTGTRKAKKTL